MGVHGLWRLIDPSGKPVPLESLENKVLAVDVSIWLHHIVKGFQDSNGASIHNAHLLGIYHRVCKLLYFRIKPVFVFDGGVPVLKRNTIALRNQQKQKNLTEAERIHNNLLSVLVKHTAISKVLSEKAKAAITASTSPKKSKKTEDDLYVLPPTQLDSSVSSSEDSEDDGHPSRRYDLHSIDTESAQFKSLPVDLRHEILSDLKDTRKQSSWGRIHELPTQSNDFSSYQMKRLLKRQSVQTALEEVEKEMGGQTLSLGELEKLLEDQGVIGNLKGNRIASDENTRYLLIKDIKQAMEEAKKQKLEAIVEEEEKEQEEEEKKVKNKGHEEFEDELKRAIALSLEEVPSTSKEEEQPSSTKIKNIGGKGKNRMPLSFLADFEDADFNFSESSEEEEEIQTRLTPAQSYMMEYSGLSAYEIKRIIASRSRGMKKNSGEPSKKIINQDENISVQPAESTSKDNSVEENTNHSITKNSQEAEVEQEEVTSTVTTEEMATESHVISDSESSSDDFVDVEAESMEVIIKPDEEVEDDIFKDIFNEKDKSLDISSTQEKVIESIRQFVATQEEEKLEESEKSIRTEENIEQPRTEKTPTTTEKQKDDKAEDKTTSQSTTEKIEKMIKTYTKSKETEEESAKLSLERLSEMKENLRKEQKDLAADRSHKERMAGNITDQMCQEAQELLELFGVPYLVAPMEAEAQCAFLDLIGLTDGTITDDSDIWLFGGRTVYRNFFDQNKIVMEFKAENIQHHYKLTREQLILLAMLVGSDYTTGLAGVGPVTALEILAAFPPKNHLVSGLIEFKSWFVKGKLPGPGRTSLRGKLKNVTFTDNFPNPQIVQAYLEPTVETSKEKFSWARPDVLGLIEFAKQKFGWTKKKSEEILHPILRRLDDTRIQKTITEFFKVEKKTDSGEPEKMMSKRVKTAVDRIARGHSNEEEIVEKKKRRVVKKKQEGDDKKLPRQTKTRKKGAAENNEKVEDEEMKVLHETEARSQKRVAEIEEEVKKGVEQQIEKKVNLQRLHKKEVIPQKQKDKSDILKNKLRAIETFRKSKQGPGYVKKRGKVSLQPKKDSSYLSEGSSSD